MDHTREILTFQFGTYANYVGAHFWNQQEANFVYNGENINVAEEHLPQNDILYREGLNDRKQPTFTPRLLSVDLVGTLVHLPVVGELYGNYLPVAKERTAEELEKAKGLAEQNKLSTHGELDVRQQPTATISEYQQDLMKNAVIMQGKEYNLSETCSSWADFLYARYHPRTFNVLQGMLKQPDVQVLGTHCAGVELWQSPAFNEEFCDRIRLYAEECNELQGFQLLFDIDDGFSGLASKCMEHLNDEYSRAIFAMPLHYPRNMSYAQADPRTARNIRVVNSVLSYKHLSEQANLFTPVSTLETIWRNQTLESRQMPGVQWKSENLYQSSALLAAYLDTVTLGYRLRQTPNTMLDFCQRVTPANRKLGAAAMALPLGMQHNQDLIDYLDDSDGSLMTQLTPGCDPGTTHVVQSVSARGIPLARLKRPLQQAGSQVTKPAYRCNSISQMLQLYYQCAYHSSFTHAASTPLPLKTHLPFPYEIFNSTIATDGFQVPGDGHSQQGTRVDSAPVLAAVQNSNKLGTHLDSLHNQTHRVQLAKLRNYSHVALEREDYESALDRLLEFRDNYQDSQYL